MFFPTVVETDLGLLVQGPYSPTPSRDNVPSRDDWNRTCVRETATLLAESLRWLRDERLLDATALGCLPMDPAKFGRGSMFGDLFEATKEAFERECLLPAVGGTYVSAAYGRLARTQELRELLAPGQLAVLHERTTPLHWLDREISQDRAPELRQYVMRVLGIGEIAPEGLLPCLTKQFLEEQDDDWIQGFYEFLGTQTALRSRLGTLPIVRLVNGSHVPPMVDGRPHAFLSGPIETSFPTVRAAVCRTEGARGLLRALGLTEPDPVDNVIRNILPKYGEVEREIPAPEYAADVERMLGAAATDSQMQRDKLVAALRETPWVRGFPDRGQSTPAGAANAEVARLAGVDVPQTGPGCHQRLVETAAVRHGRGRRRCGSRDVRVPTRLESAPPGRDGPRRETSLVPFGCPTCPGNPRPHKREADMTDQERSEALGSCPRIHRTFILSFDPC